MPAPPLKTEISGTYPNPSNAVARAGFGKVWENLYGVSGLLGSTGLPADARTALGLGNVDNTADADKPVSTAQSTAISARVAKAGDTMTGTLTAPVLRSGGTIAGRVQLYSATATMVGEMGPGVITGFGDSIGLNVANATGLLSLGTNGVSRLEVLNTGSVRVAGALRVQGHTTTASSANAVIDTDGWIYRSTSSLRYKKDVEDLQPQFAESLYKLRPVWYRSKAEADRPDWSWYGFIAEEVAQVDPRLAFWGYTDDAYEEAVTESVVREQDGVDGEGEPILVDRVVKYVERTLKDGAEKVPESVQYERFVVPIVACLQAQKAEIDALKREVAALRAEK